MADSLQEQLLKAGLSDTKKAKKLAKEKRKQTRTAQKSRVEVVDEVKLAAEQARAAKVARDRELNKVRNADAHRKGIEAQIVQLIRDHKLDRRGGDVGFNFTFEQKVKKIYVTPQQQKLLAAGGVAIAQHAEGFEVIPVKVADKIAERDAGRVIFCSEGSDESLSDQERDWYKDYEVPDDLMW